MYPLPCLISCLHLCYSFCLESNSIKQNLWSICCGRTLEATKRSIIWLLILQSLAFKYLYALYPTRSTSYMQPSQISYQAGISDLYLWSILTVALNGVSAFWSVIPQPNLPGGTQWKHPTISWLISIAGPLKAHLSFPRPQISLPSIQWQERS